MFNCEPCLPGAYLRTNLVLSSDKKNLIKFVQAVVILINHALERCRNESSKLGLCYPYKQMRYFIKQSWNLVIVICFVCKM